MAPDSSSRLKRASEELPPVKAPTPNTNETQTKPLTDVRKELQARTSPDPEEAKAKEIATSEQWFGKYWRNLDLFEFLSQIALETCEVAVDFKNEPKSGRSYFRTAGFTYYQGDTVFQNSNSIFLKITFT